MRALFALKLLTALSLLLTAQSSAAPKQKLGLSTFALLHPDFPCSKLSKLLSSRTEITSLAILWGTFGNSTKCLDMLPRPMHLYIHLSNESCRRMRRCSTGELHGKWSINRYNVKLANNKPIPKLAQRVTDILALVQSHPNIKSYNLTLGLEDNLSKKAAANLRTRLISLGVNNAIVRNNVESSCYAGDLCESHSMFSAIKAPCIYNNDGMHLSVSGHINATKLQAACTRLLWFPRWQGLDGEFVQPMERTFSIPLADRKAVHAIVKALYGD